MHFNWRKQLDNEARVTATGITGAITIVPFNYCVTLLYWTFEMLPCLHEQYALTNARFNESYLPTLS